MSTSILKALPGKLDIKRHSPSILYLQMSRPSTGISSGAFKDRTRPESDSDEDKEDHRERFKSERKMITLKSTKYTKPIPETLGKLHKFPISETLGKLHRF